MLVTGLCPDWPVLHADNITTIPANIKKRIEDVRFMISLPRSMLFRSSQFICQMTDGHGIQI